MDGAPKLNADLWVDEYGDSLFHFALARVKEKEIAEEICAQLDITANNCWVLLYRARMLLRKCLERVGLGRQQEGNVK